MTRLDDRVPLHRFARSIGGGFKPWGTIIDSLVSGLVPFVMTGPRIARIAIEARDADRLRTLGPSATRPSTLPATCSQRDALEILNLPGKHADLLKEFADADDDWEMDWDAVLQLAEQRITMAEMSARTGLNSGKLEHLLADDGYPRFDRLGWWRNDMVKALRRFS